MIIENLLIEFRSVQLASSGILEWMWEVAASGICQSFIIGFWLPVLLKGCNCHYFWKVFLAKIVKF